MVSMVSRPAARGTGDSASENNSGHGPTPTGAEFAEFDFDNGSPQPLSFHVVSLGCPKNAVDAEVMLGDATNHGLLATSDPGEADVIVVNTCGFIDAAKKESIDTIFSVAAFKRTGQCRRIVVTGCLVQRYAHELAEQIPEIDFLIGTGDVMRVSQAMQGIGPRMQVGPAQGFLQSATSPRLLASSRPSAYIKIAEGCDRHCTFCVIPKIKGKFRSRSIEDIADEAKALVDSGVLELNLVCQDTLSYGMDWSSSCRSPKLPKLVERIADTSGATWIRLLYLYPQLLDNALLDLVANHARVVKYIDMPMQHSSSDVLRRMGRRHDAALLRKVVEQLRTHIEGVSLRSAFIVGFPGETDKDFDDLLAFARWAKFDNAGFFRYSDEDESASHKLDHKVPRMTSYNRWRKAMATQRRISRSLNQQRVGTCIEAIVESTSEEHSWVLEGRWSGQAPDVDGRVVFTDSDVAPGQVWLAQVQRATDYDLVVKTLGQAPIASVSTGRKVPHLPVIR